MRTSVFRVAVVVAIFALVCMSVVEAQGGGDLQAARRAAQSRDYTTAVANYMKAISAEPSNADIHAELGVVYLSMNKLKAAESRLKKAKSIDRKNATALLGLSLVYSRKGEKDKAKELLKEAELAGAGRAGGPGGGQNRMQQRLLQQARRGLVGATRSDVKDTISISRKASQLIRIRNYKEAIEVLRPALTNKPESAMLYTQLGKAYQGQGNWTEAKEAFNKAIGLSNDSGAAARIARQQLTIITGR